VLSDSGIAKITALNMSVDEIKNYLRLYILPRFTDSSHTFFGETFVTTRAVEVIAE
jgi:hypothetical protein